MALLWFVAVLTVGGWLALVAVVGHVLYTGTKWRVAGEGVQRRDPRRVSEPDEARDPIV